MPLTDAQKINFQVKVQGEMAAGGGDAQTTINLLHYIRTAFTSPYVAANFLTAFQTAVQASYLACCSSAWTLTKITVRCINSALEPESELAVGTAGGVAGEFYPSYVAQVIGKKTAVRGRRFMGRMYIPGVAESAAADNALTNAAKTLLDTLATALKGTITDANGITFVPAVLSLAGGGQLKTDPVSFQMTQTTNMIARQILGRMRSRASKVR